MSEQQQILDSIERLELGEETPEDRAQLASILRDSFSATTKEPDALELQHTQRGFGYFELTDSYGAAFTIQQSSSAEQDKIWMGVGSDRGHLTRDMVRQIIPILQQFADTGIVGVHGTAERSALEAAWVQAMDENAPAVLQAVINLLQETKVW